MFIVSQALGERKDVGNPDFYFLLGGSLPPRISGLFLRNISISHKSLMSNYNFQQDENITHLNKVSSTKYLFTSIMRETSKMVSLVQKRIAKIKIFIVA